MIFIANIVGIPVMGYLVLRYGLDQRVGNIQAASGAVCCTHFTNSRAILS